MQRIFNYLPVFFQNITITIFNIIAYRKRYGGKYKTYLNVFNSNKNLSLNELKSIQQEKLIDFLKYAKSKSEYYNKRIISIENNTKSNIIKNIPLLEKETLRKSINLIFTVSKKKSIISKTGGTTGKSLEVRFTYENMQERFAMLDSFRAEFGYELGKRTAWFSGKSILSKRDVNNDIYWKTDNYYNIRYYSTFHINSYSIEFYINNLISFNPEFIVGFPSNLFEIANYGIKNNINFPDCYIKAIFPTAETITENSRNVIEKFFNAKIYNQYASSEGAPFIFECKKGSLHLELQSGVFEVLDKNDKSTKKGRLILTSFTTYGTPLIRYDIGDDIELSDEVCTCGNNNPLVKQILGRDDDFIYSNETGKINLGNITNTLKGTIGIVKFQVVQNSLEEITILIIIDDNEYTKNIEKIILKNWRERVGESIKIILKIVKEIPVEKSGKFRIVKNNIKHLL